MSYSSEVLADSPLLWWRMDAGGTDYSGNSRTATGGVNGASVAGILGGDPTSTAVSFDGTDRLNRNDSSPAMINPTSITVEFWIKTTQTTQALIVSRDSGADRNWQVGINATGGSGKAYFTRVKDSTGATVVASVIGSTTVNDGNPHHIVATFNGSTGAMLLYVDGVLDASGSSTNGLFISNANLDVGSYNSGSGFYYVGVLDEVAYYGTLLSGTRVSAHYSAGSLASAGGTASLSLTASGGAAATSGATASLSLTASGGANAAAGGSASLSLTASGALTPPTPAAGAAALVLSASGGASGFPGGTASLNLTATGTAIAVLAASGSATLTLTASGSAVMSAGGTATLTLSAGGVAMVLYATDLANAFDGLDVACEAAVTLTRAPAPAPPGLVPATKYDKAVPYPAPVMVGGRPT